MKNHRSILKMAMLLTVVIAAAGVRVSIAQTDLTTGDSGNTVARAPDGTTLFVASPTSDLRNVVRDADGAIISAASDEAMPQSLSTSAVPMLRTSAVPGDRFIEEDSAFGPGTLTLDTVTGFKWLDLTVTEPFTYNQVVTELEPGGMFEGYRLGLNVEVEEIMNAFGVVGDLPPQPAHDEFMGFFGITSHQGEWPQTFGYASPLVGGMAPVFGLDFFGSGSGPRYWGSTGGLLHNPGYNFKGFGTWILIESTPVLSENVDTTGLIIDKPKEDHRDVASFTMTGVKDIETVAKEAAAAGAPLTFEIPVYHFTGNDFDADGNRLVYSDDEGNMVRCIFSEEVCTIKIRYVDFDGAALDNLLPGDMTVSLEIGDTKYTNTSDWTQIDSGSGTWTKYRKDD